MSEVHGCTVTVIRPCLCARPVRPLNPDGAKVIRLQFEDAGDFPAGFAPVRSGGQWGYLNTKGRMLVKPTFDEAHEFQDGPSRDWYKP